jgi:hypothetical protein
MKVLKNLNLETNDDFRPLDFETREKRRKTLRIAAYVLMSMAMLSALTAILLVR